MATLNIRYVDPDADAGGNGTAQVLTGANCAYQSLSAWEAARQADISTATGSDSIEKAICSSNLDAGGGAVDAVEANLAGWTTDATGYIHVEANTSHGGKWNANIYRIVRTATADGAGILVQEAYTKIIGIQVHMTNSGDVSVSGIAFDGAPAGNYYTEKCIVKVTSDNAYYHSGFNGYNANASAIMYFYNCLAYDVTTASATYGGGFYTEQGTFNTYNCTAVNCVNGFGETGTNTFNAYNCYSGNNTTEYNGTITRTTCAHSSATVYSGSTASIAYSTANFVNVTSGSEDLHLVSGSALRGMGTDLSGTFTDDIDGDARPINAKFGSASSKAIDFNSSVDIPAPSGIQEGDLLVAFMFAYDAAGSGTFTHEGGWNEDHTETFDAGDDRLSIFTKVATAADKSEVNYTWNTTVPNPDVIAGIIVRVVDVAASGYVDDTDVDHDTDDAASEPFPQLTQDENYEFLLYFCSGETGGTGITITGNIDEEYDDGEAAVYWELDPTSGTSTARTATWSQTQNSRDMWIVAIKGLSPGGWDIGADEYLLASSERTPGAGSLVLTGFPAEIAAVDYPITVPTMVRIT